MPCTITFVFVVEFDCRSFSFHIEAKVFNEDVVAFVEK